MRPLLSSSSAVAPPGVLLRPRCGASGGPPQVRCGHSSGPPDAPFTLLKLRCGASGGPPQAPLWRSSGPRVHLPPLSASCLRLSPAQRLGSFYRPPADRVENNNSGARRAQPLVFLPPPSPRSAPATAPPPAAPAGGVRAAGAALHMGAPPLSMGA
ncbi:hypothetical protein NDU88_008269 [Pleurodeles waltl]|uniref:Uncharacterized protein n=1 Tax=Pleurodeles waltl TaxID=8319 RepID=A0AAV7NCL4_PLEWA|nr:hypothetical protein NDU88_008269 [Pleurodeles waltl]